jgi:Tol biopolymer transport system component
VPAPRFAVPILIMIAVGPPRSEPGGTGACVLAGCPASGVASVAQASPIPKFATEPEWSRDGRRIVFSGGDWPNLDIFVLDTASGSVTALFRNDSTDYMPSWSPDGSRIVFASTRTGVHDLYLGTVATGTVVPLTHNACNDTEPRWSPTGEWIAFRSDCDGDREIYLVHPDGSALRRLTTSPGEDGEPAWSPDGRRLVFTSYRAGQPEVFVMNADGSQPVRLTTTPGAYSRRPEWSPDGNLISFGTSRDGNDEVYVMRADGTGQHNVSRHPAREYYSRWSPDGRRILFTSNRGTPGAMYSMAADGSDVRQLIPPPRPREPIIGLPCEGCEGVFEGLPASLSPVARIAPEGEPGEPLRIVGTVTDARGNPAPGIIVYAYHTNAQGLYPPGDSILGEWARRHGRLRGWAETDSAGHYEFDTIRPGPYPGRDDPQHVHMHVIEPGCCTYYLASIHFRDDPRLTSEEREEDRDGRGGSGLVTPIRDQSGTWIVTRNIVLGHLVPGYAGRR